MSDRARPRRIHLVGDRTTAILRLAELLRAAGDEVTISEGGDSAQITEDLELVVYPAASSASANGTERRQRSFFECLELERARELGIPNKSSNAVLRERFLGGKRTLFVVGGGGRDTTRMAALCAWILDQAGLEPGFLLRGSPVNFEVSARAASSRRKISGGGAKPAPFVLEGSAQDAECIGGIEGVVLVADGSPPAPGIQALGDVAKDVPEGGLIAMSARDDTTYAFVEQNARCVITGYAIDSEPTGVTPIWLGATVRADAETRAQPFDLFASGSSCGRFALRGFGPHDVRLAVGAIAACVQGFAIELEKARAAVASFEGLR